MKVNGVFSDLLFQHWLCSSMFINAKWLHVSNIDKVHADDMSAADFIQRYERPGIPCVIRGVCDQRTEASELQRSKARDVLDRNLTLMRRVAELRATGLDA